MKIAILGAGGCFGQSLAIHLTAKLHTVVGMGRSPVKAEPYSLGFQSDYREVHLVREWGAAMLALNEFKPDAVVNFAAQAGLVPQSWEHPEEFYETNLILPVRIAKWLPKDCRYIHIGSSEVYGSTDYAAPETAPLKPSSPYAVSKGAADEHLLTLHDERITIVRPSNCYCPGQALYRLIPRAVLAGLTGKKITLQGNPQKSYMHADDLSVAIEILLDAGLPGVFNVGADYPSHIKEIVSLVAHEIGIPLASMVEFAAGRQHEDDSFWIASGKMKSRGWAPKISLREGVRTMIDWGRKYQTQLSAMDTDYRFRP